MRRLLKVSAALLFLALAAFFLFYFYPRTPILTGFAAHSVCSCHFIAGRDQKDIEREDNDLDAIKQTTNHIDETAGRVTSTIFGLRPRTAVYRKGYGCALVSLDGQAPVQPEREPPTVSLPDSLPWPYGTDDSSIVLDTALQRHVWQFFGGDQKTRAIVIVRDDRIVAEHYAPGFDKDTPQLGWSMTKSIVNALCGILVQNHQLDIQEPADVPAWQADDRKQITINHLLQMNSGLEWEEDYAGISDATRMLFEAADVSKIQAAKPLRYPPGTHWNYSSGTTNLLSGLLRKRFDSWQDYLDFPHRALFNRMGMTTMVMETDATGNYIASSYSFATPRDWAKFGLLYLHDGVWRGERLLPAGWVRYTTTPAPGSDGAYGAHFWLNAGGEYPHCPRDMYYCAGFQGQYVYILPSQNMVIVRMGLKSYPNFDADALISGAVRLLERQAEETGAIQ